MYVAAKTMLCAQQSRDLYEFLHGIVSTLNDTRAKEKPLDVVAFIKLNGERYHFLRGEAGPRCVAGNAIHAVRAVIDTIIGEQDFQEGNTTSIRRVAVADTNPGTVPNAAFRPLPSGTAARAGGVVLGGVCENS